MPYQDPQSDATRMAQKQACINEATERFRLASAAIADIAPTDRDVEAWRDWFRRQVVMARLADALHTFDSGDTMVGSPEWFRNQVARAQAHTSRIYVTILEQAAETAAVCLLEPVVKASAAAIADDPPPKPSQVSFAGEWSRGDIAAARSYGAIVPTDVPLSGDKLAEAKAAIKRVSEEWRDWLRQSAPATVDETTMYGSAEWLFQYLANLPPDVTPLYGIAEATPTAIADDLHSDVTPPEPSPVDTVIDRLSRDRVNRADRGRLGDALGKADDRADGHKAGPGEAFGRIAGR